MRPGIPLLVYFLMYENSVEEQRYLSSLEKETLAFQQLIDAKARVVVAQQDVEMTGLLCVCVGLLLLLLLLLLLR
jgi:hypothetical protein